MSFELPIVVYLLIFIYRSYILFGFIRVTGLSILVVLLPHKLVVLVADYCLLIVYKKYEIYIYFGSIFVMGVNIVRVFRCILFG